MSDLSVIGEAIRTTNLIPVEVMLRGQRFHALTIIRCMCHQWDLIPLAL